MSSSFVLCAAASMNDVYALVSLDLLLMHAGFSAMDILNQIKIRTFLPMLVGNSLALLTEGAARLWPIQLTTTFSSCTARRGQ